MNPGLEYYRPFGQPAYGTLTFIAQPAAGDTIGVGSDSYVAGTTFAIGQNINETAANFAGAVNSDRARYGPFHWQTKPLRTYYALYFGATVAILATAPGTAGNSIALTGVADTVTRSGATLSGGTASPAHIFSFAAPSAASATGVIWYDSVRTMTGSAIALVTATTLARHAILYAPSANVANVTFGPNSSCRQTLLPGGSYNIPNIAGAVYDLLNFYCNGTLSDTLVVFYAI